MGPSATCGLSKASTVERKCLASVLPAAVMISAFVLHLTGWL
jgi:hypothetical protein